MQNQGKGKGGKAEKSCFVCGQVGHYARHCWQAVRNVQAPRSQAGSSSTEWTNVTSVSHQPAPAQQQTTHVQGQGQQQPQQATQYRVSRIAELNSDDNQGQEHSVCDLRDSPKPTPKSNDGVVRAIHYYIGDDDVQSNIQSGQVRAIVSEIPNNASNLYSILLDPRLHDAQGREIPVHSMKDVEVHLEIAHMIQPILCYGILLEAGCGINPAEPALTHLAGVRVPIELQNMSATVKGWNRVISSGNGSVVTQLQPQFSICAVRADVTSDLRL